jgi:Rap1a immunity proteins
MNEFYSGQSLRAFCEKSMDECTDYVVGVYDAVAALHNAHTIADGVMQICLPQAAKDGRLMLVVVRYLNDHPKQLHSGAASVVIAALVDAFPCGTSNWQAPRSSFPWAAESVYWPRLECGQLGERKPWTRTMALDTARAYALQETTKDWRDAEKLSIDLGLPAESREFYKRKAKGFHAEMVRLGHKH